MHAAPIRCQKKPGGVARKKEVVGRAVQPGGLANLGESKPGLMQPAGPSRESQEGFQLTEHPRLPPCHGDRTHSVDGNVVTDELNPMQAEPASCGVGNPDATRREAAAADVLRAL